MSPDQLRREANNQIEQATANRLARLAELSADDEDYPIIEAYDPQQVLIKVPVGGLRILLDTAKDSDVVAILKKSVAASSLHHECMEVYLQARHAIHLCDQVATDQDASASE